METFLFSLPMKGKIVIDSGCFLEFEALRDSYTLFCEGHIMLGVITLDVVGAVCVLGMQASAEKNVLSSLFSVESTNKSSAGS